ncbi:MAG: hypothetical protein LBG19_05205 [Prevotellaceae bacterium]|jgi:hypothetical protein|nr:hypothetical protein [Prevotellaceae bacterium]
MKELEVIGNCESIKVLGNNLFLLKDNKAYANNIFIGNREIYASIYLNGKNIYCYFDHALYEINGIELKKVFSNENYTSFKIIDNRYVLCHERISRKELEYTLFDLRGNAIWTTVNDEYADILGNYLRFTKRLNQQSFTIKNLFDTILWQFILPDHFHFFGEVQIIDDVLFFFAYLDTNKLQNVYGLDIHTGKTIWELNYKTPYTTQILASLLNEEDKLCYGYGGHLYQVFSPLNGEILLTKDMTEYYKQGVSPVPFNNTIADGKLWFVSGRGERSKFGVLNTATSEVEFIQDYPLENDEQLGKPIFHNNKLYILDTANMLHIFE